MFLKRIEASGFKSFADKTNIIFDYNVTGIVGPNGCGKSNTSDAIRWVLGEQSPKQLRGTNMADVIFNGSAKRKPMNKAEVTLVFDNTHRVFPIDYDEVEITRVLYRSGESEYLLNKTNCRLKDITNLIMDTGLGRDSLSIISQDKIQNFAKARPEDRRAIFEEAAGVAKYKKRKLESVSKLDKTQENLESLELVIGELEQRLNPLRRQAEKARKYLNLKSELEGIEVSVIIDDINNYNEEIQTLMNSLTNYEEERLHNEVKMNTNDAKIAEMKAEVSMLEREINIGQEEYARTLDEIKVLESRKFELDEKRRAWLEANQEMSPEKIQQMQKMCEEARLEYFDRQERMNALAKEAEDLKHVIRSKQEMKDKADDEISSILNKINRSEQRKAVIENQIKSPLQSQQGVKSVMEAKKSLPGIEGVIVDLVKPENGYENAISTALGGALYNILATDPQAATNAINFLKKNEGGRATFLPLTSMQVRPISKEHEITANAVEGYLGLAKDHATIDEKYQDVVDYLLGQVLVCSNLESANEVSKLLRYGYRVVTLDGDVVNKGGSMTGGKQRNQSTPMALRKEAEVVENSLSSYRLELENWQSQAKTLERDLALANDKITTNRIDMARLEQILSAKKEKFEKLSDELKELGHYEKTELVEDSDDTSLVMALNAANAKRDSISSANKSRNERRYVLQREIEKIDEVNRELRRLQNGSMRDARDIDVKKAKAEAQLEMHLNRLNSEYSMTYEYASEHATKVENILEARQQVILLRQQIDSLGNVNMEAPDEYDEVNTRYNELTSSRDELYAARDQILDVIKEMDDIMAKDFMETFEAINQELKSVFSILFGGGHANLYLVDPENILESGIEIDAQPPGKAVKSNSLLSGGEMSLIALAVLFSIMRCRRVPLCILDECDSALDPANVKRFSRFLNHFNETQFIVVTHRPGTMEQCDYLYGVTMQDRGITQMLHVKLSEAVQLNTKGDA